MKGKAQTSILYKLGNGGPKVNGIIRLCIAATSALAAGFLGLLAFLGASIYGDVHNLNVQAPVLAQHTLSIDQHLANIDGNSQQMWLVLGEMRDRIARLEGAAPRR